MARKPKRRRYRRALPNLSVLAYPGPTKPMASLNVSAPALFGGGAGLPGAGSKPPELPTVAPGGTPWSQQPPYPGFKSAADIQAILNGMTSPIPGIWQTAAGQVGSIIGNAGAGIAGAYEPAAQQLAALGPQIRQTYTQAAGDQARLGSGYGSGFQQAIDANAAAANDQINRVAGGGQQVPMERGKQGADVIAGLANADASGYWKAGQGYADAADLQPESARAMGRIASAKYAIEAQSKLVDIYQQMNDSIVNAFQDKLQRGEALNSQQISLFQNAQDRAYQQKRDLQDDIYKQYQAGLISPRDMGKMLNLPGWEQLSPDLPTAEAEKADLYIREDPATGMTTAIDKQTGEVVWRRRTGTPKIAAGEKPTYRKVGNDVWEIIPGMKPRMIIEGPPDATGYKPTYRTVGKDVYEIVPGQKPRKIIDTPEVAASTKPTTWRTVPGKPGYVYDPNNPLAPPIPIGGLPPDAKTQSVKVSVAAVNAARKIVNQASGGYIVNGKRATTPELIKVIGQYGKDDEGNIGTLTDEFGDFPTKLTTSDLKKMSPAELKALGIGVGGSSAPQDLYEQASAYVGPWRAFNMVARKYPKWGTASRRAQYFPKGSAAADGGASLSASQGLSYPLGVKGEIKGFPYQGSHTLYGNWQSDNAIDIYVPVGTPVYAVADGKIGSRIGPFNSQDPHLTGSRVTVETGNNAFYYAHLSKLAVKAGQTVKKGDLIGYSGSANGADHLHIGVQNGNPVDMFSNPTGRTLISAAKGARATTPEGAQAVAKRMAWQKYKWGAREFRALAQLWQGESSWSYKARNPTSGALGIPQALGHTLPQGFESDPVTQIKWGLDYIKDRYKTPQAALSFKLAHGWY